MAEKHEHPGVKKFLEGAVKSELKFTVTDQRRIEFQKQPEKGEKVDLLLGIDLETKEIFVSDLNIARIICDSKEYLETYIEVLGVILRTIENETK